MAVAAAVAGGGGGSAHQQRQADNKNRQIAACETGRAAGGDRSPYFGYASTLCCFLREARAVICPRLPVFLLSFASQVGLQVKLLSPPRGCDDSHVKSGITGLTFSGLMPHNVSWFQLQHSGSVPSELSEVFRLFLP